MIYLDTGCLVKLYYPEPESQKVASFIKGRPICFNPLHELEFTNAIHLKLFHGSATAFQVQAAAALVEADVKSGVFLSVKANWETIFRQASDLARQHTASFGCRSLDGFALRSGKGCGSERFPLHGRQAETIGRSHGIKLGVI